MDYNYNNNFILLLIFILLAYNLYPKIIGIEKYKNKNKETFQQQILEELETELVPQNLKYLENEPGIFNKFCKKIKYINNNFNDNSRQILMLNNTFNKQLNLKKQQSNELLQNIIDLQKKIHNIDEEVEVRSLYERKYHSKVTKQLDLIKTANSNIKTKSDNYKNSKIVLVKK
jgi:hypothetical protein